MGRESADLKTRLMEALESALSLQRSRQAPLVYRDDHFASGNKFIHEYPDGSRFLISQNSETAGERVICAL